MDIFGNSMKVQRLSLASEYTQVSGKGESPKGLRYSLNSQVIASSENGYKSNDL
jgi:hypothetical protein